MTVERRKNWSPPYGRSPDKIAEWVRQHCQEHGEESGARIEDFALINHDNLVGFVANEHIDHTGVSISAGTGLSGGGTIAANRTLALSHLGLESLADPGADRIMFWDESAPDTLAWLSLGNSLAITATTLDAIQDIRTSASPSFAGLTLSSTISAGNSPVLSTSSITNPGISTYCNYLEATRSGAQAAVGPTHNLQLTTTDDSTSVISETSGALSIYSHLIGNNSGGITSHPDYWGLHHTVELTTASDCIPRMFVGGEITLDIKREYTVPAGGTIRGLAIMCNLGSAYPQKGDDGAYIGGQWKTALRVAPDDANNTIDMAAHFGNHGIQGIKTRSSDPVVADMEDGEINLGSIGAGRIYWKTGNTIFVFHHDSIIT